MPINSKDIQKKYPLVRQSISRASFLNLYDALIEKMVGLGLPLDSGRSAKFYGMGEWAPKKRKNLKTVAALMLENPPLAEGMPAEAQELSPVNSMLEELRQIKENVDSVNFGDYLYKRKHELDVNPELDEIEFVGKKYVYGYFVYLGFDNLDAFEKYHAPDKGEKTGRDADTSPKEDQWTYYIGAYFSVKSFGVRTFVLGINYTKPLGNKYPAREWGFHKLGDISSEDMEAHRADLKYDGYASIVDKRWLCVQLEGSQDKNPFFLIGVVPDTLQRTANHRLIRGILLSVSVRHYPVTAEAILIKTTKEHAFKAVNHYENLSQELLAPGLSQEESNILKLYIMLQRRNFYTSPSIIESISNLNAKGSLLKNFTFISGVYRILNFGLKRDHILQSVMVVEPNQYRATLYPYIKQEVAARNKNLLAQSIVFSISRIRQNKLCLTAYGDPGMSISSYAIFDLETDNGNGFFEGCFISCGYDSRGIIGGYCVVQKVDDDATKYLEIQAKSKTSLSEAEAYAEEHKAEHLLNLVPMELSETEMDVYAEKYHLQKLRSGLREIWRKKLWKQRKVYGDDYPYRPEMIKWGNKAYILHHALSCKVHYDHNNITIAFEPLGIQVSAEKRQDAEIAFCRQFHTKYEQDKNGYSMDSWIRRVIEL